MATEESERALLEGVLGRPVAEATQAAWGFQNRTDLVTLGSGDRVVVQRYRRRQDAVPGHRPGHGGAAGPLPPAADRRAGAG